MRFSSGGAGDRIASVKSCQWWSSRWSLVRIWHLSRALEGFLLQKKVPLADFLVHHRFFDVQHPTRVCSTRAGFVLPDTLGWIGPMLYRWYECRCGVVCTGCTGQH